MMTTLGDTLVTPGLMRAAGACYEARDAAQAAAWAAAGAAERDAQVTRLREILATTNSTNGDTL